MSNTKKLTFKSQKKIKIISNVTKKNEKEEEELDNDVFNISFDKKESEIDKELKKEAIRRRSNLKEKTVIVKKNKEKIEDRILGMVKINWGTVIKSPRRHSEISVFSAQYLPRKSTIPLRNDNNFTIFRANNHIEKPKICSKEIVLSLLSKHCRARTDMENRIIGDYLYNFFEYFRKIRRANPRDFIKLMSVLKVHTYLEKETIFEIGDEKEFLYIVFDGRVGVYRPKYCTQEMQLSEFCEILDKIKYTNRPRFLRLIQKNSYLGLYFENLINAREGNERMRRKRFNFTIEEEEELGVYENGFVFGDLNLIRRNRVNNKIKALSRSTLIAVSKYDFNRILKTFEEKRLELEGLYFQRKFPIFSKWVFDQLISLFNCFFTKKICKDEYLFKQNEESDEIFLIESGKFEVYVQISFNWIKEYLSYIGSIEGNLLTQLDEYKPNNEREFNEMFDIAKKKALENKVNFPLTLHPPSFSPHFSSLPPHSLSKVKLSEEALNDPANTVKITIREIIDQPVVFGLEECLDMKHRFFSVRCMAGETVVKKIRTYDILKLLYKYNEFGYSSVFLNIIIQKKKILIQNICKHLRNKVILIENELNKSYDNLCSVIKIDNKKVNNINKEELLKDNYTNSHTSQRNISNSILSPPKKMFTKNEANLNYIYQYINNNNINSTKELNNNTSLLSKNQENNYFLNTETNKKVDYLNVPERLLSLKLRGWTEGGNVNDALDESLHLSVPKSEIICKKMRKKRNLEIEKLLGKKGAGNSVRMEVRRIEKFIIPTKNEAKKEITKTENNISSSSYLKSFGNISRIGSVYNHNINNNISIVKGLSTERGNSRKFTGIGGYKDKKYIINQTKFKEKSKNPHKKWYSNISTMYSTCTSYFPQPKYNSNIINFDEYDNDNETKFYKESYPFNPIKKQKNRCIIQGIQNLNKKYCSINDFDKRLEGDSFFEGISKIKKEKFKYKL